MKSIASKNLDFDSVGDNKGSEGCKQARSWTSECLVTVDEFSASSLRGYKLQSVDKTLAPSICKYTCKLDRRPVPVRFSR